jgi:hypothetical protein
MENGKTCPKCPNSPPMKQIDKPGFIYALSSDQKVSGPSEAKQGFSVRLYECPHCHLIEFYST